MTAPGAPRAPKTFSRGARALLIGGVALLVAGGCVSAGSAALSWSKVPMAVVFAWSLAGVWWLPEALPCRRNAFTAAMYTCWAWSWAATAYSLREAFTGTEFPAGMSAWRELTALNMKLTMVAKGVFSVPFAFFVVMAWLFARRGVFGK